jgi:glutathione S-transferase
MSNALATRGRLVLHQPPGGWGEPSISPFCMKLECWLHMAGLGFDVVPADMRRAPKGKIPFVVLPDGTLLGDSQLIIEHLARAHGVELDAHLTDVQLATARVVRRMLEEASYFVGLYGRWIDDEGWPHTRVAMGKVVPRPFAFLLPLIRRRVRATARAQGTGRHDRAEIYALGRADWDAIETLFSGPYFFGEKASSLDAALYGFEESLLSHPASLPVKQHLLGKPRLVAHRDRMRGFFPPERFAAR